MLYSQAMVTMNHTWNGVEQPLDEKQEDFCVREWQYRFLQQGLEVLLEKIGELNRQAKALEIQASPYGEEVDYLERMIQWGKTCLERKPGLVEQRVSIKSLRYLKAGLLLLIMAEDIKYGGHLPDKILRALSENIEKLKTLSEDRWFNCLKPDDVFFEIAGVTQRKESLAMASPQFSPSNPLLLFDCYSHADLKLRNQMETHLSPLRRENLISEWHDRKIGAGKEWEGEIDANLNAANIVLLLVTATFIHSEYCYGVEMKRALKRHDAGNCRVIPIILRDCDWKKMPFGTLEALPDKGKAVTGRAWKNTHEAFADIARGVRNVVEELAGERGR